MTMTMTKLTDIMLCYSRNGTQMHCAST